MSKNFENLRILNEDILSYYPKQKIAIIGNAGVTQQDNEAIDQADVVVRFNNYATREGITHSKDRHRCDMLFTTTDLHSSNSHPKDIVIGIPSPFKQDQVLRNIPKWYPDSRYWMVNPYTNYLLCKELGYQSNGTHHPLPSIGLTALYHLRNFPCEIYIGGFQWYFDWQNKTVQGCSVTLKNLPTNFNHFYIKEMEWIIKNLKSKKNILFSDQSKRILDYVESKL